ncbi:MAG: hypothetical protein ABIH76_05940, partial [Candidatus Bathyarchaeota archaeon]
MKPKELVEALKCCYRIESSVKETLEMMANKTGHEMTKQVLKILISETGAHRKTIRELLGWQFPEEETLFPPCVMVENISSPVLKKHPSSLP